MAPRQTSTGSGAAARQPLAISPAVVGRRATDILSAVVCVAAFPPTGIVAVFWLRRARHLAADDVRESRAAYDRFRRWRLLSAGYAVAAWLTLFVVSLFLIDDRLLIREFFDWDIVTRSFRQVLKGFVLTIKLFVIAEPLILLWSLIVAVVRSIPGTATLPLRWLAAAYVDVFRGLPCLLVIMMTVFGIKQTSLPVVSDVSDFWLVVIAIVLTYGAYVSETMRAGLRSVHESQVAAARSMGLGYLATMRFVVLPQAVRNMAPPLMNAFISLQKDTSLVAVVGLLDALARANGQSIIHTSLTPFTVAAIGYLVIVFPVARLTDHLTRRGLAKRMATRRTG
ncbi:MAG: amino acid ABC transporter permease [Ilumatobacteraceae bacterium]